MIHFRTTLHVGLLAGLLGLGACGMTPMMSSSNAMSARLSGASEVPPVTSNGSGTVEAVLNKQTNALSWTVTYAGLSGPATAGHFHGPAMAGQNAGVAVPIPDANKASFEGSATLTDAQAADMM